jgi:hypothetical protein
MYKSASQVRSPERNQIPEPLSAEDIRKQAVRDEALAKLEGKPKTKRSEKIARDDAVRESPFLVFLIQFPGSLLYRSSSSLLLGYGGCGLPQLL